MKIKIYRYIAILFVLVLVLSCEEDINDKSYKGPDLVEFQKSVNGSSGVYVGDGGAIVPDVIVAQIVGRQQNATINMNFEIDPASTAIAGVHYNLITNGQFTIPSGSYFGEIEFEVLTENFDVGEQFELIINITGGDLSVSENFKSITHTMEISCSSDLAGTYNSIMDGNTGDGSGGPDQVYSGLPTQVILTADASQPGVYSIDDMSFGLYPIGYNDIAPMGRIQDLCGQISDLGDRDRYGDPFTISGTDNGDGTITISWSNTFGDVGTGVLTKQ